MGIIDAYRGIIVLLAPLVRPNWIEEYKFFQFSLVLYIGWGQSDGRITWLVGLDQSFSSDLVPVTSHWDH